MRPTAYFMMGGPGSGKSYVRDRDDEMAGLAVVDCDQSKEAHPDYDPKNPAALHAWSSEQCVKAFFRALGGTDSFVYDGTGSNSDRMVEWMLDARTAGFDVALVYVRCPLNTALERNRNRERVVPEHVVIEKHSVVERSFAICSGYADRVREIDNG